MLIDRAGWHGGLYDRTWYLEFVKGEGALPSITETVKNWTALHSYRRDFPVGPLPLLEELAKVQEQIAQANAELLTLQTGINAEKIARSRTAVMRLNAINQKLEEENQNLRRLCEEYKASGSQVIVVKESDPTKLDFVAKAPDKPLISLVHRFRNIDGYLEPVPHTYFTIEGEVGATKRGFIEVFFLSNFENINTLQQLFFADIALNANFNILFNITIYLLFSVERLYFRLNSKNKAIYGKPGTVAPKIRIQNYRALIYAVAFKLSHGECPQGHLLFGGPCTHRACRTTETLHDVLVNYSRPDERDELGRLTIIVPEKEGKQYNKPGSATLQYPPANHIINELISDRLKKAAPSFHSLLVDIQ